jgi:hypothetical protein
MLKKCITAAWGVLIITVASAAQAADTSLTGGSINAGEIDGEATIISIKDKGVTKIDVGTKLTKGTVFVDETHLAGKLVKGDTTSSSSSDIVTGNSLSGIAIKNAEVADITITDFEGTSSTNVTLAKTAGPITVTLGEAKLKNVNAGKVVTPSVALTDFNSTFFSGAAWGAGLAYLWNSSPVISDAYVGSDPNKTLRANAIQQSLPELVLTRHYYLTKNENGKTVCTKPGGLFWDDDHLLSSDTCVGFFIAAGVSNANLSSSIIDLLGIGIMAGFGDITAKGAKAPDPQMKQHNIGLGIGRRFGVKQLADGFSNNVPIPTNETQVRYKTVDTPVIFLMYSYTLSGQ